MLTKEYEEKYGEIIAERKERIRSWALTEIKRQLPRLETAQTGQELYDVLASIQDAAHIAINQLPF